MLLLYLASTSRHAFAGHPSKQRRLSIYMSTHSTGTLRWNIHISLYSSFFHEETAQKICEHSCGIRSVGCVFSAAGTMYVRGLRVDICTCSSLVLSVSCLLCVPRVYTRLLTFNPGAFLYGEQKARPSVKLYV